MSIVSYAQNFEDVILWRALQHIDQGFYIDIGANDPVVDSVSLAFYENGWRGVHVEPVPTFARSLTEARPDEYVEQVAVGSKPGHICFYEIEGTGLSTADPNVAEQHKKRGFKVFETEVDCISLDQVFEKHGKAEIHWLKIDVEGRENDVLESWNLSNARPWVLIIESTVPLSKEESYQDWEALLLEKGYLFAYFDGLNRFYVHNAHAELKPKLDLPPNVFDGFVLSGRASNPMCALMLERCRISQESAEGGTTLENEIEEYRSSLNQAELKLSQTEQESAERTSLLEKEIEKFRSSLEHAHLKLSQAESRALRAERGEHELLSQLQAILSSTAWRITFPLRWLVTQLRLLRTLGVKARTKSLIKKLIMMTVAFISTRPKLKKLVISSAKIFGVERRLRALHYKSNAQFTFQQDDFSLPVREISELTPRSRKVYAELKLAIENKREQV